MQTQALLLLNLLLIWSFYTTSLVLKSPCKINLFLRILGRRETGFHDLASLFQTISLFDEMKFSLLPETAQCDILTCSDTTLEVDDSNLVIKALNLMRNKTGKCVCVYVAV